MTDISKPADPPLTQRAIIALGMIGGSCLITIGLAFEQGWRQGLVAISASLLLGAGALGLQNMRSGNSGRGS